MRTYAGDGHVNVGSGTDLTIRELAERIIQVVGFTGQIVTDESRPDGTPQKLMAVETLRAMGWHPRIDLSQGLASTYAWYLRAIAQGDAALRGIAADRG